MGAVILIYMRHVRWNHTYSLLNFGVDKHNVNTYYTPMVAKPSNTRNLLYFKIKQVDFILTLDWRSLEKGCSSAHLDHVFPVVSIVLHYQALVVKSSSILIAVDSDYAS